MKRGRKGRAEDGKKGRERKLVVLEVERLREKEREIEV